MLLHIRVHRPTHGPTTHNTLRCLYRAGVFRDVSSFNGKRSCSIPFAVTISRLFGIWFVFDQLDAERTSVPYSNGVQTIRFEVNMRITCVQSLIESNPRQIMRLQSGRMELSDSPIRIYWLFNETSRISLLLNAQLCDACKRYPLRWLRNPDKRWRRLLHRKFKCCAHLILLFIEAHNNNLANPINRNKTRWFRSCCQQYEW